MSDENALAVPEEANAPVTNISDLFADSTALAIPAPKDMTSALDEGNQYSTLSYLSIVQGQSKAAKSPYKIPVGNMVIKGRNDHLVDLGEHFDGALLDVRYRATEYNKVTGDFSVVYNQESEVFKIFQTAANQERQERNKPRTIDHYWGFEFLVYVGDTGEFVSLYCNNPTLRRAARENLFAYVRKGNVTISSVVIKDPKKGNEWNSLVATDCETPFVVATTGEAVHAMITQFKDEKEFLASSSAPESTTRDR